MAQAVEARLRRKVFVSASQADVSVEGSVSQAKHGATAEWRAALTIRDARGNVIGTREVQRSGTTCSEALDESIVFVVSVMIDPDAALGKPNPEPEPQPPPPPPPPPPEVIVKREEVVVQVEPPDPWHFEANAGAVFSAGLLPSVGFGMTAAVLLKPPGFWGIEFSGTYWGRGSVDSKQPGTSSDVALAYGGVALCPLNWEKGVFSYRGCAGVELGTMQSRGVGFPVALSDEALVAHVFLPSRFGLRVAGPLVVSLGLSLIVPIVRAELSYRESNGSKQAIFRPAPIAGATDLSLGLRFP
ncbi:hypothetical protein LVJ94_00840 [Pendulispora rubella]|uniref:Bacterial surface antigen (D15) domain-containing protein n=1 Tax=Pendulispora rubella TaxID=2741070 RepID=A0ABZ2L4F3_9BACT